MAHDVDVTCGICGGHQNKFIPGTSQKRRENELATVGSDFREEAVGFAAQRPLEGAGGRGKILR
jgi:hypothetical protein